MSHEELKRKMNPQDSYREPAGDLHYVNDNGDYAHLEDGRYNNPNWIVDMETGEAYVMRYNILGKKDWTFPKQFEVSKKLSKLGDSENIYRIHTYPVSMTNYHKVLGNGNADFLAQERDSEEGAVWEAQTFPDIDKIYGFVERIQSRGLTSREKFVDHIRLKGNGIR